MRRNESPDFVGLDYLKKKHAAQIAEFESVRKFALPLIEAGLNFRYLRRDCSEIFLKE